MRVWGNTDKGLVRETNQDAFIIKSDTAQTRALLVLCDGMGGAKSGDIASRIASDTFTREVWERTDADSDVELLHSVAHDAVRLANIEVNSRADSDPDCAGMGTTLVAAIVHRQKVVIINIGDSRAYRVEPDKITRLTRDHSVVEDMMISGDITLEQARSHPSKNLITRAIGGENLVEGDIYEQEFAPGEYLLLCSDGLSNMLEDGEILDEIVNYGDAETACDRLILAANARGGRDNITVVLLEF